MLWRSCRRRREEESTGLLSSKEVTTKVKANEANILDLKTSPLKTFLVTQWTWRLWLLQSRKVPFCRNFGNKSKSFQTLCVSRTSIYPPTILPASYLNSESASLCLYVLQGFRNISCLRCLSLGAQVLIKTAAACEELTEFLIDETNLGTVPQQHRNIINSISIPSLSAPAPS